MSDDEVCGGAREDATAVVDDACGRPSASGGDEDEDRARELRSMEEILSQKDFIMEPDAIEDVKRYVARGGAPSTAIELMSENYRGYAAMTSLAVHWLRVTAPPRAGTNTSPIKVSASVEARVSGVERDHTPTGGVLPQANSSEASWGSDARFDELYFMETLVRERFDVNKADAVFEGRPPAWLDGLFRSERGRALLYSLAEEHPNCLLISCAIQHAWQRGMRHEVRALGPAAAAYFSIFHELLADHIKGIVAAGNDSAQIAEFTERVKSMCCQSIGAYVFGQLMLASLARDEDEATSSISRSLAARLSEEIEEAAARLHGAATIRRIAPWLAESAADASVKYAMGDLLTGRLVGAAQSREQIRDTGALAAGDLKKLLELYVSKQSDCAPSKPSVAPLRHPDVLYNLVAEAFKWTHDNTNRLRGDCFELISLAVSDETTSSEEIKDALNAAVSIIEDAKRGQESDKVNMDKVFSIPAAAAGVVAAVRSVLTSDAYHRIVHVGNANDVMLQLLSTVARKHAALQGAVLEALTAIVTSCGRSHGDELVISLLDVGCELVAAGHVIPTIAAACDSWRRSLEASQIRYFAEEVLEIAGPPYGRDFAVLMIHLLESSNSRKKMSKAVDEFVDEVRMKRRELKLSLSEVNTLDALSR